MVQEGMNEGVLRCSSGGNLSCEPSTVGPLCCGSETLLFKEGCTIEANRLTCERKSAFSV